MSRYVIDASVALKCYLPEPEEDIAKALWRALAPQKALAAPDLIYMEMGNALWKRINWGRIPYQDARDIFYEFRRSGVQLVPIARMTEAALDIAVAIRCSVYDGVYIASAALLQCQLLTADEKLLRLTATGPFSGLVKPLKEWSQ